MDSFQHIQNVTHLHHAYLIRGDVDASLEELEKVLTARNVRTQGNPDFYRARHESFLVEDARHICNYASLKPVEEKKYIVIGVDTINTEAQSALLKAVEEGTGHSIFFFLVGTGVSVLPTLLSRCVVLGGETNISTSEGEDFLKLSYAERIKLAEKLAKNQDKTTAKNILKSLLVVHQHTPFPPKKLKELLDAHTYLSTPSSSIKTILGHIALIL
ncbi:hypothetical protein COU15_01040 [Candidatus Kaiserbacteria bacterium CG10_big_fil_rev_8_21_14_0_10_45_20]|uniref:DNA polymerase III subunit delta n=1 Tax=Candidatus Kaiserbacteria bacterium CG10_big_fil_rev_8_21_14_0_10_45_20 TaxID=1974607 RepID=A0A2H0UG71_9BACT|nr:MAG: hypothetical protein COU15_01040 [Candidatus Kaiserbacteria bacterium CG10_big_fil_rev_8_21_14_0_10_45_20]